ncbi:SMP-30/gluconolactonase/LRE family protein [Nitrospinota bacterium]
MVTEAFSPGFERIVPKDATVELLATGFIFTEGPIWNGRENHLSWVDIIGDTIYRWVPGEGTRVIMHPSGKANGLTYDHEGRIVVAGWGRRTVWRWEHDGSTTTLASHYQGMKLNSPNDIVVKSDGAVYFTDPSGGMQLPGHEEGDVQRYLEHHGVYRLDPDDGKLTLLTTDVVYPNGLCFSPDESLLYVNDSRPRLVWVWDVQPNGTVKNRRLFEDYNADDPGGPDGMKVDVEGNVYCTGPGGVWVTAPDGTHLGRIKVPEHCANFVFGGSDLKTLYMTARTTVYRTKVNIPGIPTYPAP